MAFAQSQAKSRDEMQMRPSTTRRAVLTGLAAGSLITGFDLFSRSWLTGEAASASTVQVPKLTGQLLLGSSDLSAAADDYGHIVHQLPRAVLEPGDVNDIAVMLQFCSTHQIPAAPRGQGHATNGQAQALNGLVIEMSPLDEISINADGTATVQAGALWSSLLQAALAEGLTPPVFTDYIELSVGGTLSAGGIGGASPHFGAQVDTVLELDVVTGAGQQLACSPATRPDLFHAVLSGLGQCAVLVRAKLQLVAAPQLVHHYMLFYPTVDALTADQRLVQADGRFSFAEGGAQLNADGSGFVFYLEAGAYYDSTPPEDSTLIGDLHFEQGSLQVSDLDYLSFIDRLAPDVAFLESTGEWFDPHPWWNMFLPDSQTDSFVTAVMASLSEADIGASGLILLYPLVRSQLQVPLLRVPDEPTVFLFSVLRTAAPDSGGALPPDQLVQANRTLFEQGRALGGNQYPIGSIPMTPADWRQHFGPQFARLAAARARFDPAGILTPGQGIFARTATH